MKAIILAAGYATRMYPLTKDRPKALLPIGGKVMLDYLMDEIATIDEIDTVYIVTNSRFSASFPPGRQAAGDALPAPEAGRVGRRHRFQRKPSRRGGGYTLCAGSPACGRRFARCRFRRLFYLSPAGFCDRFPPARPRYAAWASTSAGWRISSALPWPRWIRTTALPHWWKSRKSRRRMWPFTPSTSTGATPCPSSAAIWTRATPRTPPALPQWLYSRREVGVYLFEGECIDIGTPEAYKEVCERFAPGE